MKCEGKHIYLYGGRQTAPQEQASKVSQTSNPIPLVIVNTFEGDGQELYELVKQSMSSQACPDGDFIETEFEKIGFYLAVISDIEWNDEMTPGECPPLFKKDKPYTGGAKVYLDKLVHKILPEIENQIEQPISCMIIAGYSLGGLFSLYSLYETDVFTRAVSASGSMWFPGFWEFINEHEMKVKPERIYMSLGDQEAKSKNPYLCTVQEKTEAIYKHFEEIGLSVKYELNPGNHFQDADERLAKGIAWCLQEQI